MLTNTFLYALHSHFEAVSVPLDAIFYLRIAFGAPHRQSHWSSDMYTLT